MQRNRNNVRFKQLSLLRVSRGKGYNHTDKTFVCLRLSCQSRDERYQRHGRCDAIEVDIGAYPRARTMVERIFVGLDMTQSRRLFVGVVWRLSGWPNAVNPALNHYRCACIHIYGRWLSAVRIYIYLYTAYCTVDKWK